MAQQMRKFEQEAIASEIIGNIKKNQAVLQKELENSNVYQEINTICENMKILQREQSDIGNQISNLRRNINNKIEDFNDGHNDKSDFRLNSNYDGQLEWNFNEWSVKQEIENKLAIALLSDDWSDKLPQIIEDISNQYT
tara:strand:+ start:186 stop:602 length:417 start_codon:yes stop_codon:yes gene_type:complete